MPFCGLCYKFPFFPARGSPVKATMSRPQLPSLPTIELPAFLEPLKLKKFPLKTFPATYEPAKPEKPALHVFGPGWEANHTSFDVDCLAMQVKQAPR
jgi:hypothetical protein